MFDWGERRARPSVGKKEWEAVKKLHGNKCKICGVGDKKAGGLEKAHIKAHSRGGSQLVPMCATCHKKYDSGKLNVTELRKIGLTAKDYKKLIPSKKKKSDLSLW